jgi:hypothetical protein
VLDLNRREEIERTRQGAFSLGICGLSVVVLVLAFVVLAIVGMLTRSLGPLALLALLALVLSPGGLAVVNTALGDVLLWIPFSLTSAFALGALLVASPYLYHQARARRTAWLETNRHGRY